MRDGSRHTTQTLILQRPVEPLDMCIVVALPDTGVTVREMFSLKDMREPGRELGTMVSLDHLELERCFSLRSRNE